MDKFTKALTEGRVGVEKLVLREIVAAYEKAGHSRPQAFINAFAQLRWRKIGEADFMPEVLTKTGDRFILDAVEEE
jgi:hypothetical protein